MKSGHSRVFLSNDRIQSLYLRAVKANPSAFAVSIRKRFYRAFSFVLASAVMQRSFLSFDIPPELLSFLGSFHKSIGGEK